MRKLTKAQVRRGRVTTLLFACVVTSISLTCWVFGEMKPVKAEGIALISPVASITPTPSATPKATATPSASVNKQILNYIVEKFGDRASDAITMLNKCENHKLDPNIINKGNSNGTWDVGVFQINVDPSNTSEVEKLKDWKYNIDRAYAKYHSAGDKFYHWTCGYEVGDKTYLDALRGK